MPHGSLPGYEATHRERGRPVGACHDYLRPCAAGGRMWVQWQHLIGQYACQRNHAVCDGFRIGRIAGC